MTVTRAKTKNTNAAPTEPNAGTSGQTRDASEQPVVDAVQYNGEQPTTGKKPKPKKNSEDKRAEEQAEKARGLKEVGGAFKTLKDLQTTIDPPGRPLPPKPKQISLVEYESESGESMGSTPRPTGELPMTPHKKSVSAHQSTPILPASPQKRGDEMAERTVYFEIIDPTKCLPNREVAATVMVYKLRIAPVRPGEPERKSAVVLAHEAVKALLSADEALHTRKGEITRMEGTRLISMGTSSVLAKVDSIPLSRLAKPMYIPLNTEGTLSAQIGWAVMSDLEYTRLLFSGNSVESQVVSEQAPKNTSGANTQDNHKQVAAETVDDSAMDIDSPTAEFNREFINASMLDADVDWELQPQDVHEWLRKEFDLPVLKRVNTTAANAIARARLVRKLKNILTDEKQWIYGPANTEWIFKIEGGPFDGVKLVKEDFGKLVNVKATQLDIDQKLLRYAEHFSDIWKDDSMQELKAEYKRMGPGPLKDKLKLRYDVEVAKQAADEAKAATKKVGSNYQSSKRSKNKEVIQEAGRSKDAGKKNVMTKAKKKTDFQKAVEIAVQKALAQQAVTGQKRKRERDVPPKYAQIASQKARFTESKRGKGVAYVSSDQDSDDLDEGEEEDETEVEVEDEEGYDLASQRIQSDNEEEDEDEEDEEESSD
ncbi:hypothetical protein M422DRAFT_271022 [Sphaerobolus stellatus SS14]|uniref:Unplaced genomic scaffold SPHSTscaffold_250, whole genome shotgun sequence n=1 Tax=Sphaerobolus stellatus (strain SS14) TaxID=990650 RepID=A0A0C9UQS2_SPHS4|nr:hypothetical protein M422DRAFT_271022 [Sphaerobolus stellatus SS14]